jgi:hypothetical protein
MRFCILIILLGQLLTVKRVMAQNSRLPDCLKNNEDINGCLIIGGLSINSDRNSFTKTFGKPDDIQFFGDTTIVMYKLPRAFKVRNPKYKHLRRPYLLIEELDNRTQSIQLNGYNTKLNLNFYGISLGTDAEKVTEVFGAAKTVWPWKLINADIWYFENKTYAFLVQDSKVVGIRLLRK